MTKSNATETNFWLKEGFPASLSYITRWELRLEDYKTSETAEAIMVMQLLVLSHSSSQSNASSLAESYDETMKSTNENIRIRLSEAMVNCMVKGLPLNPYIELLRELQDPGASAPSYECPPRHKNINQMIRLAIFRHPDLSLTINQRMSLGSQMARNTVDFVDLDDEKTFEELSSTRKAIASLLNLRKEVEFPAPMRKIDPDEIEEAFLNSVGQGSKWAEKSKQSRVELHHLPNKTTTQRPPVFDPELKPLHIPPPVPNFLGIRTVGARRNAPAPPFQSPRTHTQPQPQPQPRPQRPAQQAQAPSPLFRHTSQPLRRLIHRLDQLAIDESQNTQEQNSMHGIFGSPFDLLGTFNRRLESLIEMEEQRVRLQRQMREARVQ